jgi:hypothetical protein
MKLCDRGAETNDAVLQQLIRAQATRTNLASVLGVLQGFKPRLSEAAQAQRDKNTSTLTTHNFPKFLNFLCCKLCQTILKLKLAFKGPFSTKDSIHHPLFTGLDANLTCMSIRYTVAGMAPRNLGLHAILRTLDWIDIKIRPSVGT